MDYKEIAIYSLGVLQILIAYVYRKDQTEIAIEFSRLEKKIETLEKGEFIEKTTRNVLYTPECRDYFKSIFNEALDPSIAVFIHQKKNENSVDLAILNMLEKIDLKLTQGKHE